MKDNEKNDVKGFSNNEAPLSTCAGRDVKGRFVKGNKIATDVHITGVRSIDVRKHRAFINAYIPQLLQMLIDEAIINKNIHVAMWLVSKIIPNIKVATLINSTAINAMNTLGELRNQSSHTLKESIQGDLSLEVATMLMNMYKEHKNLIEAADIESLAQELAKRIGRSYGKS
jgi:hypothetical protein